jgi:hypothetical protein
MLRGGGRRAWRAANYYRKRGPRIVHMFGFSGVTAPENLNVYDFAAVVCWMLLAG